MYPTRHRHTSCYVQAPIQSYPCKRRWDVCRAGLFKPQRFDAHLATAQYTSPFYALAPSTRISRSTYSDTFSMTGLRRSLMGR